MSSPSNQQTPTDSGRKRPRPSSNSDSNNSNNNKRHQRPSPFQPAWKQALALPAFMDASASVTPSTYGARRLPEIKALSHATTAKKEPLIPTCQALQSGGGKTSSRHLRRRVTCHQPRSNKRHRFPHGGTIPTKTTTTTTSKTRKGQRHHTTTLTAIHETWWRSNNNNNNNNVKGNKDEQSKTTTTTTKEKANANNNTATAVHWMTTHLWHAKRFHMAKLWGWQIPMVHTNRGSKAALRLAREGKALIQDVTWRMGGQTLVFVVDATAVPQLPSQMKRVCPDFSLPSLDDDININNNISSGQGIVYELDQFPRNAMGPITWLVSSGNPLMMPGNSAVNDVNEYKKCIYIYIWTHPAIRASVWRQLQALQRKWVTRDNDGLDRKAPMLQRGFVAPTDTNDVGMACFVLRGIHATATIQNMLLEPDLIPNDAKLARPLSVSLNVGDPTSSNTESNMANNNKAIIDGRQALLVLNSTAYISGISKAPATEWTLYCDAKVAKDVFLAFILKGGACPIGVVEEAYLQLECHPPMAKVFPRDFPETDLGRQYWSLSKNNDYDDDKTDMSTHKLLEDLTVLRLCLEHGEAGGRVPVPTIQRRASDFDVTPPSKNKRQERTPRVSAERLTKISWMDLVKGDSHDENDNMDSSSLPSGNVVMMRGPFGQPILDVLSGSGKLTISSSSQQSQHRRNRRKAKRPNESRHVMPLSSKEAETHHANTHHLLQSLSLPAVIACHIQVVSAGTLQPGGAVYYLNAEQQADSNPPRLLGYVTSSCYSVSRGQNHGTAVVGAASLLRSLVDASSNPRCSHDSLAVEKDLAVPRIRLIVHVKIKATYVKASLALLL